MTRVGETMRAIRRACRLRQQAVADHLGISRASLVATEKGRREPRMVELARFACLVRISPEAVYQGDLLDEIEGRAAEFDADP